MSIPVIAIDGPSGVGKSTVARRLLRHLGYHLLVSGALYRAVALLAGRRGIVDDDKKGLQSLLGELNVQFVVEHDNTRVLQDGSDISRDLLSESCANHASRIAKIPELRVGLLEYQRSFRISPGLVADGRDMGTVVFPDAKVKVFLTASLEERANRRSKQLNNNDFNDKLPQTGLVKQMAERDKRDSDREHSPLEPAGDSIVIDTTHETIDQVVDRIIGLLGPTEQ